jgi:hypothetical protein
MLTSSDVSSLGEHRNVIKKNTEGLLDAGKKVGREGDAEETTLCSYFVSRLQVKKDKGKVVRFEVLTAVGTKMAVFWVVAPCSLVEIYQRFRELNRC